MRVHLWSISGGAIISRACCRHCQSKVASSPDCRWCEWCESLTSHEELELVGMESGGANRRPPRQILPSRPRASATGEAPLTSVKDYTYTGAYRNSLLLLQKTARCHSRPACRKSVLVIDSSPVTGQRSSTAAVTLPVQHRRCIRADRSADTMTSPAQTVPASALACRGTIWPW